MTNMAKTKSKLKTELHSGAVKVRKAAKKAKR